MHNDLLLAALYYSEQLRWSVIPLSPGTKIPPAGFEVIPFRERIASRQEIEAWWRENPRYNVGIITGKLSGVLVVDHDKYKPQYSEARALELIPDNIVTPTSATPQGGEHQAFSFPDKEISIGAALIPAMDYRGEGGYIVAPPSVNSNGKAYRWLKGLAPDEVELGTVPDALLKKLSLYIYREHSKKEHETTDDEKMFTNGRRDNDLFTVSNALIKGGLPAWKIAQVLEHLIISWGEIPDPKWIEAKIESAKKRDSRRSGDVTKAIEDWVSVTDGNFSVTDCFKALQPVTLSGQDTFRVILHRLAKRGIIEKYGNKDGVYRRIDREVQFMDFANADTENHIDLSLPLGLHAKTKLFPKAVTVVAGVSGMGKTLYAFNTIADNMGRFPIFYFNSEMGPEALKQKLSHFPIPISEWNQHMKVIDNWDFNNIADKVQPDAFNVIDYLEPEGERPYNIHGVISAIIRRLNKGTALITIQKKPGATMGTGGIYSIKAATLALAMDWGKLEIVKNRFREADTMPHLTKINFEVHQGYKFVKQGNWYK